ncbi:RING finger protein [Astathelohania contejeani]|uniref:RING finger protein n=1 Tax=Astathelohania contejeani TaxID=164912 RepID=A0ABQ7HYQ5_9MICR|nr:RING finger protein [Thelohania contejeani]
MANDTLETKNNEEPIVLSGRPISMQRRVYNVRGPDGNMNTREIIIIETEASLATVLLVLGRICLLAILFQFICWMWRKAHPKSHRVSVFITLWVFPPFLFWILGWWNMILLCLFHAIAMGWVLHRAIRRPIRRDTPRKTYGLFRAVFLASSLGSMLGQVLTLLSYFGWIPGFQKFFCLFFCSLYFGLLSRELIEALSGIMATNMGYYSKEGVPEKQIAPHTCAVCDGDVQTERIHTLNCGHSFHEDCIRGWCLLGKKAFCPCCRETVDTKSLPAKLWQKGEAGYVGLLDFLKESIIFCMFLVILSFYRK